MKRYVTAVLAAAAVLTGISAPAASADSPGISTPRQSATGRQLNNLMWTPTLSMSGTTIWMLRMQEEPPSSRAGSTSCGTPTLLPPPGASRWETMSR